MRTKNGETFYTPALDNCEEWKWIVSLRTIGNWWQIKVNTFKPADNEKFKWPTKETIHEYLICDIKNRKKEIVLCDSRESRFNISRQLCR